MSAKKEALEVKLWFEMLWSFFKVGICTFGGGYAMLPVLQREVVDKKKWVSEEEVLDYYAVGQCTPGVIAVNTATFVGYKYLGVWGGIACTIGFILPSFIIILSIAAVLTNFAELSVVMNAFAGIRVCVCVLILNAVLKLWKKAIVDKAALCIFLVVFACMAGSKYVLGISLSPVVFVILAALAGIILKVWGAKKA